jgi:tetratricopeptide (TPR) repeat protein
MDSLNKFKMRQIIAINSKTEEKLRVKILFLLISLIFTFSLHARQKTFSGAVSLEGGRFFHKDYYENITENPWKFLLNLYLYPGILNHLYLKGETGIHFSPLKADSGKNYTIFPLGLLGSYHYPVFENFFPLLRAGGGFYVLKSPQGSLFPNFYLKAGIGAGYQFKKLLFALYGDYEYYHDSLEPIKGFQISAGIGLAFGGKERADLEIEKIQINKMFAAQYPTYYEKAVGEIEIKNDSSFPLEDIRVGLHIKNVMDGKSVTPQFIPFLESGKTRKLPLYAYFNKNIKYLENGLNTTATITVEYNTPSGERETVEQLIDIEIYGRNALYWDKPEKLGSFLTSEDPAVIDFARKAVRIEGKVTPWNRDLENSVKIMETLRYYGLKYVSDPGNSTFGLDYIQYPRETLEKKTGDCDDLSVLLMALLESIGVKTAVTVTRSHVFVLMEAGQVTQKTVEYRGKRWIPLEATRFNDGFVGMWKTGLENFGNSEIKKTVETAEAAASYPPLQFESPRTFYLNTRSTEVQESYSREVDRVKEFLNESSSVSQIDKLSVEELNHRGVHFAKKKDYEKAEKLFLAALEKEKKYKNGYYNLVRLYSIQNLKQKAEKTARKFLKFFPGDTLMKELIRKHNLQS